MRTKRLVIAVAALCGLLTVFVVWQALRGDDSGGARQSAPRGTLEAETPRGRPSPETAPEETAGASQETQPAARARPPRPAPEPAPEAYRLAEATADPARGALRVLVTDENGLPRAGASLAIYAFREGQAHRTHDEEIGPAGRIEIPALEPGGRAVWVSLKSLRRMVRLEIVAGRVTEVEVAIAHGAVVEGSVRHVEKGPLGKITLKLERKNETSHDFFRATTDAEGRYRLENVPPGTYPVSLTGGAVGYHPAPRGELVVTGPGTLTRDFVVGAVRLRGVVRDEVTGLPLPGVSVQLQKPLYRSVTTDAQGAYVFLDLPPGDFPVALTRDGYGMRFARTGPVPAKGERKADFALRPAATLVLHLTDPDGQPIPGRHYLGIRPLQPPDGTSVGTSVRADEHGIARYAQILPGSYELTLRPEGFERKQVRVEVAVGENDLRVRCERTQDPGAVGLRGTVRDATTNLPLAGVSVRIQSPIRREAITDAQGVYRLRDLRTAACVVIVSKEGYGITFHREVKVEAGQQRTRDFTLARAATLHLVVTDRRGRPVTGSLVLVLTPTEKGQGTRLGTGVRADADGRATYREVLPGHYRVRVSQGALGSATAETEIKPGSNTVHFRLE
ncbi:MAG: carboxypeptidase regulatory-like domain-containing protein [Planctomycetota bacterium]|jgi:hypothetical protein